MSLRAPSNLVREENFRFALQHLPPAPSRVLEVGCGDGELAADLSTEGYEVMAVDRDPEAVAAALEKGISAEAVDFLDFEDEDRFDVVLFTRSLHHVSPLDEALDRAAGLLAPKGTLLVDDFCFDEMDAASASWFYGLVEVLKSAGIPLAGHEASGASQLDRWLAAHRHEPGLTPGREMRQGVRQRLGVESCRRAPYLYRYFHSWLDGALPYADTLVRSVFRAEKSLIREGAIRPLGLRLVASLPPRATQP